MWIKCQDGTLVNTNQVFNIIILDEKFLMARGESPCAHMICNCSGKEEAEKLRDGIYEAINEGKIAYSVLAEDQ